MNSAKDFTALVDELAAHWTEPVLEIFKATGIHPISVNIELKAWRALKKVLHCQFGPQQAFRLPTLVSLSTVMERALRRATLLLAVELEPESYTYDLGNKVGQLAGERRSTEAERRIYAEIVRRPPLRAAFKPPSRTDFTPRLRLSALSG